MRVIRKNVEREAEGVKLKKLLNDGYKPVDTAPNQLADNAIETFGAGTKVSKSSVEAYEDLEAMSATQLKMLAKEKGLNGYSGLSKEDLIRILKG